MDSSSHEIMFNTFYEITLHMLDEFYPTKTVTVTNRDPHFVTPFIKFLLRKRNKLMDRNKTEAADAVTARINKLITKNNSIALILQRTLWTIKNYGKRWERYLALRARNSVIRFQALQPIFSTLTFPVYQRMIDIFSPTRKPESNEFQTIVEEIKVFGMMDSIKPTSFCWPGRHSTLVLESRRPIYL